MSKKNLCTDCPKMTICNLTEELCEEAETYANQDEVTLREITGLSVDNLPKSIWPAGPNPYVLEKFTRTKEALTDKELMITAMLNGGLSRKEVCRLINITRGNLRVITNRIGYKVKKASG